MTRYFSSDCEKQLRLLLHPESGAVPERLALGMPLKQPPRPGLNEIAEAGRLWAGEVLGELSQYIGPDVLIGNRGAALPNGGLEFRDVPLEQTLPDAAAGTFLAEHQFEVTPTFQAWADPTGALNDEGLAFDALRPDLIAVLEPRSYTQHVTADGTLADLATNDKRLQLRVIDIKLTSEPGPGYFAEVVYYSLVLAGWLTDRGWDNHFVVCPEPAIWPGSHQASSLWTAADAARSRATTLAPADAFAAVTRDLEPAPFHVFSSRITHFFTDSLPRVLAADWRTLPFHVSAKCRGCDFLGDDRGRNNQGAPDHCQPLATSTGHLSRIPFISRGATRLLTESQFGSITDVANTPHQHAVYDQHHSLRAQRTVIGARAASLVNQSPAALAPLAGTSAVLPRHSDLSVYITADFDTSSAITLVLGVSAFWSRSQFNPHPDPDRETSRVWRAQPFVVDPKSLHREEAVLLQFLDHISGILDHIHDDDSTRAATFRNESTVQFYLWDDLTYRHLSRIVGRHLDAIIGHPGGIRALAWLFPPEDVIANSRMRAEPYITIVSDSVRALLTLPLAHHYSLLDTARWYHTLGMDQRDQADGTTWGAFPMPPLFEDHLSDQIPSERAHDIWKHGPYWQQSVSNLGRAVHTRLQALEEVTKRLRNDLGQTLRRNAPRIGLIAPPANVARLTADELVLLAFTKLNAAVDAQDKARIRAMPAHEREARFASIRMERPLDPQERPSALQSLGLPPTDRSIWLFKVATSSLEANFKEGAFACALVPEDRIEILDWTLRRYIGRYATHLDIDSYGSSVNQSMGDVLAISIARFDRDRGIIAVRLNNWNNTVGRILQDNGIDLNTNVCIEETTKDFFSRKLQDTLQSIGRTPKAVASPAAARALGTNPNPRRTARAAVEDPLWDAPTMALTPVARDTTAARAFLEGTGRQLNPSQWSAFEHALTRRLALIWGPPGTGKSRTVTNIVAGAAHNAVITNSRLRVLVTSNTYTAVDNVLSAVADYTTAHLPTVEVHRIRGSSRDQAVGQVHDTVVSERRPTHDQLALETRLTGTQPGVTVVGGSPHQVFNLAANPGGPTTELFDLVIIDEASQTDVATSILALAPLADDGCIVIAGDPLQLPPIHHVEPPENIRHLVGSIYDFFAQHHGIRVSELLTNYRSNATIVGIGRDANYPSALAAHSPSLSLNLLTPLPDRQPANWPADLAWTPALAEILDPARPVTCLVHKDGLSGQSNPFESQTVAALAHLLSGRLANQLDGELDPTGAPIASSTDVYTDDELLTTGIGVVTPHRAQQSMVTRHLSAVFPNLPPHLIRGAVDTVERFQGQQRDVIIATYAVGDPDTVAQEAEFLQSLQRFNVMASRARAKLLVMVSEELVQHLPHDLEVLRASSLLKAFVDLRCADRQPVELAYFRNDGTPVPVRATVTADHRWV